MDRRLTLLAAAVAATVSLGACGIEDTPPQPRISDASPAPGAVPAPAAPTPQAAPPQPTPQTELNAAAKAEAKEAPTGTVPPADDEDKMRTGKPSQEVVPTQRESIKAQKAFEG